MITPVAHTDVTGIALVPLPAADDTYVIDFCTHDDTAWGRLRLLLDGSHCSMPGRRRNRTCQARH